MRSWKTSAVHLWVYVFYLNKIKITKKYDLIISYAMQTLGCMTEFQIFEVHVMFDWTSPLKAQTYWQFKGVMNLTMLIWVVKAAAIRVFFKGGSEKPLLEYKVNLSRWAECTLVVLKHFQQIPGHHVWNVWMHFAYYLAVTSSETDFHISPWWLLVCPPFNALIMTAPTLPWPLTPDPEGQSCDDTSMLLSVMCPTSWE